MNASLSEEQKIEIALVIIGATTKAVQTTLDIFPAVRVTFQYGGAIETLTYDWDGEGFTA